MLATQQQINIRLYIDEDERRRIEAQVGEFLFGAKFGPSSIKWVRPGEPADISLFADSEINIRRITRDDCKIKMGILLEPLSPHPGFRAAALLSLKLLDFVLTYDDALLRLDSKFRHYSVGSTQLSGLQVLDPAMKTELASMSLSKKKYMPGHKLRHSIASRIENQNGSPPRIPHVKLMGGAFQPYSNPLEPYSNFYFSIVIENERNATFFTEKLIECLLVKCVPIYWGAWDVGGLFDMTGILAFQNEDECLELLKSATPETYKSLEQAILYNQKAAYDLLSKDLNIQRAMAGLIIPSMYGSMKLGDYTRNREDFLHGRGQLLPKHREFIKLNSIASTKGKTWSIRSLAERARTAWKSKIRYRTTLFLRGLSKKAI